MASKLIIDRIQPDMKLDENGNLVWTPRLIDYNAAAYSRGHVVTSDEFNTELLKQTYQGNYNTDTISVLVSFYNGMNATTKQALNIATNAETKATQADVNANNALLQMSSTIASVNVALERANAAAAAVEAKPDKNYVDESVSTLAKTVAKDLENYYTKTETDALDAQLLNTAKQYTNTEIAALIDSAPETLDTFKEIADAFAEDQEVLNTLNAAIGLKANQTALDATNTKVTALETSKADKDDVPNTYLEDATVVDNVLTVSRSDGTSFQFEGGGGLTTLNTDTKLTSLEPNIYHVFKGSGFWGGSIKFYFDGSTTNSYVSIRNGFINVTDSYDSYNMTTMKQFFGDVYIDGIIKDGVIDNRSGHVFIMGFGDSTRGNCTITYFYGNDVIATRQYVDNNTAKIIWEEWE